LLKAEPTISFLQIMKNIYNQLAKNYSSVKELVLATVTRSHGSTPQKPGCSAIIGINGVLAGTVGGGIVEGKVINLAAAALSSGQSGHYTFDLAHEISDEAEAICGGSISVLVDANIGNSIHVFNSVNKALTGKIPGVLITMVTSFTDEIVM
jgi:xanthine dehydrogenase accessory factor